MGWGKFIGTAGLFGAYNVTDILEALSVLKIPSNSRTWMYGKGTSEPGWRICAGCVAFI